ncbi:MAG: hypothetical protein COB35_04835 [Gammaproteobacteria bacterium]|nr:MAG: hypothetical protein COB35_04835 [Gammaproteobacteria bacterium]
MSNIYTYEVDHGDKAPSVGASTEINGGKVTAVCFTAQLENNQKAHEILQGILDDDDLCNDTYDKLIVIQNLI